MEFVANDLLKPKSERKTIDDENPLAANEIPRDILRAVRIDFNDNDLDGNKDPIPVEDTRFQASIANRWICCRRTTKGMTSYWTSPKFATDFASTQEIHDVFKENPVGKEVVDFWVPPSEKHKVGRDIFHHIFLHKNPNQQCFVTKTPCGVRKRKKRRIRSVTADKDTMNVMTTMVMMTRADRTTTKS